MQRVSEWGVSQIVNMPSCTPGLGRSPSAERSVRCPVPLRPSLADLARPPFRALLARFVPSLPWRPQLLQVSWQVIETVLQTFLDHLETVGLFGSSHPLWSLLPM